MDRVRIDRFNRSDQGCFGRLVAECIRFACFTGELPDRGNTPSISCIPAGIYLVVWAWSPRLRRFTYRLLSVPRRSGILKHSANFMGDVSMGFRAQLNGCIALGERIGVMDGQRALLVSAPAVRRFESLMAGRSFELEIVNA